MKHIERQIKIYKLRRELASAKDTDDIEIALSDIAFLTGQEAAYYEGKVVGIKFQIGLVVGWTIFTLITISLIK